MNVIISIATIIIFLMVVRKIDWSVYKMFINKFPIFKNWQIIFLLAIYIFILSFSIKGLMVLEGMNIVIVIIFYFAGMYLANITYGLIQGSSPYEGLATYISFWGYILYIIFSVIVFFIFKLFI